MTLMRRVLLFLSTIFVLLFSATIFPVLAQTTSPHFSLSPTVKEVNVGETFNVTVTIDTGGDDCNGADAIINYDSSLLEVTSTQEGSFFPTITIVTATVGEVSIYGVADTGDSKSGSGTLATITFKGKAAGTATVNFSCQENSTTDSNINDTNDEDVVICSENVGASYVINEATSSATATPTTAATTTNDMPESGFLKPTLIFLGGGILLTILGFGLLI